MANLMTLDEMANYLRVTEKTLYRLIKQGRIPATKVGRQWRFDKAAIDDWLIEGSVGAKAKILVIDDEEVIRLLFKEILEELGHQVITAEVAAEAIHLVEREDYDLIFVDLKMPGVDGAEARGDGELVGSRVGYI